ncbi:hypothetical protein R1sor_002445 [Riccia sorocarpa]|uniref:SET domain-containing protein n=1 Tax=Riccia sorocarpa TaxID=122646 RepID=A0ABD3GYU5_9MARC
MTKTAIEAARHIQQWGRHDEGESSRGASDRRGEVQSRPRPAIREILRHRFIQFSMTAIQDFSTQLRTSRARSPMPQPVDPEVFRRALETLDISALFTPPTSVPASLAVPPPDLARHAQPEPEVERQVDQVVDPVVAPVVEPEVEPTVSVESHHPSTEVHGVVGESIMVVERYVAPHRDDDTSGCSRISPPPLTPPRTRRGRRGSQSLAANDSLVLHIPSRVVRRAPEETRPTLFPYAGTVYSHDEWLVLLGAYPTGFRTYLLDVDSWRGSSMPREEYRFVDGDPARCPNLAGYINNVIGTRRPQREPNVMWVLIEDPPASYGMRDLEFHVATVPTRPIQAGEELLCDYPWGSGFPGSPCVFPPRRR